MRVCPRHRGAHGIAAAATASRPRMAMTARTASSVRPALSMSLAPSVARLPGDTRPFPASHPAHSLPQLRQTPQQHKRHNRFMQYPGLPFTQRRCLADDLAARSAVLRELAQKANIAPAEVDEALGPQAGSIPGKSNTNSGVVDGSNSGADLLSGDSGALSLEEVHAAANSYDWFSFGVFPQLVCDGLTILHDTTGIPFAPMIIIGTVAIRTLLFPFVIKTQQNAARLQLIQPQLTSLAEKLKVAKEKRDRLAVSSATEEMQTLMATSGANPLKSFMYMMPQAMIFIPTFFGIRRLAESNPDMAAESFLWIPSLAAADPFFILPVLFGAGMIVAFEMGAEGMTAVGKMRYAMWGFGVLVPVLTYSFPAAVHLFWIAGTTTAVLQTQALARFPALKKAVGVPIVPDKIKKANARNSQKSNPLNSILDKMPLSGAKPPVPTKNVARHLTSTDELHTHHTPKQRKINKLTKRDANAH